MVTSCGVGVSDCGSSGVGAVECGSSRLVTFVVDEVSGRFESG